MTRSSFRSHAKVNLHLQVVGRRPDGYHELRTVFQMIDLHDSVEIVVAERGEVQLTVDAPGLSSGPDNLAWKAAATFRDRWAPGAGIHLRLRKRIPLGAGLGGGSSNAATVLLGLRALCGRPAEAEELWPVARELGADVPFFLLGGTALGFGRGDEAVPLPEPPPTRFWLVLPPVEVPTGPVFRSLGDLTEATLPPSIGALVRVPKGRGVQFDALCGWNDLQGAVFRLHPDIAGIGTILEQAGATWICLSGSGSALVARFPGPELAETAAASLPSGCRLLPVRTVGRRIWRRQWAGWRAGSGN